MAEDKNGSILGDMNSYILDWLVAKPAQQAQGAEKDEKDEGNRINTLIAMLTKDSGGADNVVPFKSRKK